MTSSPALAALPPGEELKVILTCRRLGILPTRHLAAVDIARQRLILCARWPAGLLSVEGSGDQRSGNVCRRGTQYWRRKIFRCSTSRFGVGEAMNSNCTPRGLHRISEKIGGGWPVGTIFRSRIPVGFVWQGEPGAPITSRILWLEGLEPGLNRGGQVDSRNRYIYIHGTGDETTLGRPASRGCIHLAADALIPLHDFLPIGTLVWIF